MGNAAPDDSGQALARLRIGKGLSARQLAELAGVSHTAVNHAERGRPVKRPVWIALEAVLGPLDFLPVWPPYPDTPLGRARRVRRELTREAAERAGVARSVYERAEAGERVHPATAKKIADAFGLEVTDVLPVSQRREASDNRQAA